MHNSRSIAQLVTEIKSFSRPFFAANVLNQSDEILCRIVKKNLNASKMSTYFWQLRLHKFLKSYHQLAKIKNYKYHFGWETTSGDFQVLLVQSSSPLRRNFITVIYTTYTTFGQWSKYKTSFYRPSFPLASFRCSLL